MRADGARTPSCGHPISSVDFLLAPPAVPPNSGRSSTLRRVEPTDLRVLEPAAEWRRSDFRNPDAWTEHFGEHELRELADALRHAKSRSTNVLELGRDDFPLPELGARLRRIERELVDGRGFAVILGVPRDSYDKDDASLLYWGIGMHLGRPWPQNKKGHLLGDVTDQGKSVGDYTSRGNEIGGVPFPY